MILQILILREGSPCNKMLSLLTESTKLSDYGVPFSVFVLVKICKRVILLERDVPRLFILYFVYFTASCEPTLRCIITTIVRLLFGEISQKLRKLPPSSYGNVISGSTVPRIILARTFRRRFST